MSNPNPSKPKRVLYSMAPNFTPGYKIAELAPPNFTDWTAVVFIWLLTLAWGLVSPYFFGAVWEIIVH